MPGDRFPFDPSMLPVSQLESAKYKITQMIESIVSLQKIIEADGHDIMPAWPDILAKYNVLLSQTHTLSMSLLATQLSPNNILNGLRGVTPASSTSRPLAKLALHPSSTLAEAAFDNDLIPLLRNQQTTEVLRLESETVRRLSSLLPTASLQAERPTAAETFSALLQACEHIRTEHDSRCKRAERAVTMLRDNFDWKTRVAIESEEPEDFVPLSPMSPQHPLSPLVRLSPAPLVLSQNANAIDEDTAMGTPGHVDGDEDEDSGDDDAELEEVLGPSLQPTPGREESAASTPQ